VTTLVPLLGDQLSLDTPALRAASPDDTVVVMAEVPAEIERYPNHKQRVVMFLSAMRHFRDELRERGLTVAEGRKTLTMEYFGGFRHLVRSAQDRPLQSSRLRRSDRGSWDIPRPARGGCLKTPAPPTHLPSIDNGRRGDRPLHASCKANDVNKLKHLERPVSVPAGPGRRTHRSSGVRHDSRF
jgi:hypothetical protein